MCFDVDSICRPKYDVYSDFWCPLGSEKIKIFRKVKKHSVKWESISRPFLKTEMLLTAELLDWPTANPGRHPMEATSI